MKDSVCFGSASHEGIVRKENQDSIYVGRNKFGQTFGLVCDGLGGYKGGKIASSIVTEMFKYAFLMTNFHRMNDKQIRNWFADVLQFSKIELHKTIVNHETNENDFSIKRMATTIVCSLLINSKIHTFWVGDSRAYLIDNDKTTWQISKDHNLYNYFVENHISQKVIDENRDNLLALTNIVGGDTQEDNKQKTFPLMEPFGTSVNKIDDHRYILLCSDGFYNFVDSQEYYGLVLNGCERYHNNLIQVCGDLLKIGMQRLSNDNLSVVIIDLKNCETK